MWKEENEFRKRIRPIHIQIIFSWLDFPIFFLLPFRKLKLDQNPIIGKKNRNWDTSKCPLVWLSWKSTTPFRPRLQSNLQKYERRSEGHNINVISDIPTLQQFLDIVANFLFSLFPLENIKKNRGSTLRYIYAVFLTKKSPLFTRSTKWVFTCFGAKKRSRPASMQTFITFHWSVCAADISLCTRYENTSKLYQKCSKQKVSNCKKLFVIYWTIASIFAWT